MNICAVVILYEPDIDFVKNIKSYKQYVKKVYIIDNSLKELDKNLIKDENIQYIFNNENQGISKSLNKASSLAIKEGFDYITTMDQDSCFVDFKKFLKCIKNIDLTNVAMVSANPSYDKKNMIDDCTYENVNRSITSGSILNLDLYKLVGNFDENLFIDEVDFDYCLRAKILGYEILLFKNIYLEHNYGTKIENIDKYRVQYPAIRVYYMTRNRLYMSSKYRTIFPEYYNFRTSLYQVIYKKIYKIWKYEDDKLIKITAIFKGLWHFIIKKYGKYD